jgi:hypothetical protein
VRRFASAEELRLQLSTDRAEALAALKTLARPVIL